jgi:hypothetical protein
MPTAQKGKGPAVSARPFLEPSYLLADFRLEIDRALALNQASDPGRVFGPGGSAPAAAVRVSARRPAVDPASVRGSGSAGRDFGSDWTLRSPFFQSRRGTTVEPAFGCEKLGFPAYFRWFSQPWFRRSRSEGNEKLALYKLLRRRPAQLPRWVPAVKNRNDATSGCRSLRCVKTRKWHSTVGSAWIISPSN